MGIVVETWTKGAGMGEIGRRPMLTLQRLYHHAICGTGVGPTHAGADVDVLVWEGCTRPYLLKVNGGWRSNTPVS